MGLINVDIRIERNKIKRLRNCEVAIFFNYIFSIYYIVFYLNKTNNKKYNYYNLFALGIFKQF